MPYPLSCIEQDGVELSLVSGSHGQHLHSPRDIAFQACVLVDNTSQNTITNLQHVQGIYKSNFKQKIDHKNNNND